MRPVITSKDRSFLRIMGRLVVCNHFLPERIELERKALGEAFVDDGKQPWNLDYATTAVNSNIRTITGRCEELVSRVRPGMESGGGLSGDLLSDYESLVGFVLYQHFRDRFKSLVRDGESMKKPVRWFDEFKREAHRLIVPARKETLSTAEAAHHFAVFAQVERAFIFIFNNLVGTSASMARLRASVWESIFTCNFRRYSETLHGRMHELTTLITGPSGTGKELVARAIACSAFIPFDSETRRFSQSHEDLFLPLNLSALSTHLVESELFGHKRGAFTGALQDHVGWLEGCPRGGAVFLDEIGETEAALQVKLLRVLQTRSFQRLGESQSRLFQGKIIAATNRDLETELRDGRFREDFYYRLCSDVIQTPSLHQQLRESPDDLPTLVRFVAVRLVGEHEADGFVGEVVEVIERQVGPDHLWPGNFRELEQCVRNVLVRQEYRPPAFAARDAATALAADLRQGALTANELLSRYCSLVYSRTNNLEETARRLDVDRRTVKARLKQVAAGRSA